MSSENWSSFMLITFFAWNPLLIVTHWPPSVHLGSKGAMLLTGLASVLMACYMHIVRIADPDAPAVSLTLLWWLILCRPFWTYLHIQICQACMWSWPRRSGEQQREPSPPGSVSAASEGANQRAPLETQWSLKKYDCLLVSIETSGVFLLLQGIDCKSPLQSPSLSVHLSLTHLATSIFPVVCAHRCLLISQQPPEERPSFICHLSI